MAVSVSISETGFPGVADPGTHGLYNFSPVREYLDKTWSATATLSSDIVGGGLNIESVTISPYSEMVVKNIAGSSATFTGEFVEIFPNKKWDFRMLNGTIQTDVNLNTLKDEFGVIYYTPDSLIHKIITYTINYSESDPLAGSSSGSVVITQSIVNDWDTGKELLSSYVTKSVTNEKRA